MWAMDKIIVYAALALFGISLPRQSLGANVQGSASGGSIQLGVLIPWTVEWDIGEFMGSAIGVAVEEVQNRSILSGYSIDWEWRDTQCQPLPGLTGALDLWDGTDDLDAFIGGGCTEICKPIALVSAAWNIPYVSFGCSGTELSDKVDYPTFTRSVGTWVSLAPMFEAFASWFDWERVGILSTTENIMQLTADAITTVFESHGNVVFAENIETAFENDAYDDIKIQKQKEKLRILKENVRVIILLMYDVDIHSVLLGALDEGMMTGDFVFIAIDADLNKRNSPTYRTSDSLRVYEHLISANLRKPISNEWDVFAQAVIAEFQSETKFNGYAHLPSDADVSLVDVHAGMLHDAVLMWAYGVNLTLASGQAIDDGVRITDQIRYNLTFQGITGTVTTNINGDRKADYVFQIAYQGSYVSLLTWYAVSSNLVKDYMAAEGNDYWDGIYWPGNRTTVPLGRPECGWYDEFCTGMSAGIVAAIAVPVIFVCVTLLTSVIGVICYRRWKYERELREVKNWKISWSELSKNKLAEQIASSRVVMKSSKTYAGLSQQRKFAYAEVADCKGTTVCIKRINKSFIDVDDRDLLVEIKETRDLKHDNVNPFIGACVDAPNIAILMEYAAKGSIQDIIQNESINLNWDFKMSIASDVAKGMQYLHRGSFGSHGHLTSANCVVDSRWVCKITDYGMGLFKKGASPWNDTQKEGADLLWTAPELLREKGPGMYGTELGDVYSYGIILQELIVKDGPFADVAASMQPADIVAKVREGLKPPFRPKIPVSSCVHQWRALVDNCWQEDPCKRPDFTDIIFLLKEINGGKQADVIENMIKMLEQHTEHLEELMADRTAERDLEKKKVNTLLNNMLPKTIASALSKGNLIGPEHYENITIAFMNVVGYTAFVTSFPSPEKLVRMLNDLCSLVEEVVTGRDVYKIETISGATMMTSGVPERNGNTHAGEIATVCLDMMSRINDFKILDKPGHTLQLRIGIHTGPVLASVVGMLLPRFCLFGETMDIASHIETGGMALRIHVSPDTANVLETLGGYQLDCRGLTSVKGRGEITTYWLCGKDGFTGQLPDMSQVN